MHTAKSSRVNPWSWCHKHHGQGLFFVFGRYPLRLREIKGEWLEHGQFLEWLGLEFDMSDRMARRFMLVAEKFGKMDILSNLPISVLYELASPSMPEEVVQGVIDGDIPPGLHHWKIAGYTVMNG